MPVQMKAPQGCKSCSSDGQTYVVNKGVVVVPAEVVASLYPHGFEVIGEVDESTDQDREKLAAIEEARAIMEKAQANFDAATDDTARAELTTVLFDARQKYEALTNPQ